MYSLKKEIKMWKYARERYKQARFERRRAVLNVECTVEAINAQARNLEFYRGEGAAGEVMAWCCERCLERFGEMLEDNALAFELACEDIKLWEDIGTMSLFRYLIDGFK